MPKVIRGECVSCAGPGVPSLDFGQSCAPLFDSRQVVAVQTPQTPSVHAGTALERCTMHDIALFFFTINGRDGGETNREGRETCCLTHMATILEWHEPPHARSTQCLAAWPLHARKTQHGTASHGTYTQRRRAGGWEKENKGKERGKLEKSRSADFPCAVAYIHRTH